MVSAVKHIIRRAVEGVIAPFAPLTWRARPAPRLLVLMYHRVLPPEHGDRAIEQPGMYVSPATLDMHLRVLQQHFTLIHLDEWVTRAAAGDSLPRQACALTFDDGWRDNFEYAFPILRRHAAPATIFLVSGMTGTDTEFWPNRLARTLVRLRPGVPLPGRLHDLLAATIGHARSVGSWSLEDLDRAIGLAKQLGDEHIVAALDEMDAGLGSPSDTRAVLDESELRIMASSGLVRFGSHTRTHRRFQGDLPPEVLEREIAGSREDIVARVGKAGVGVFCYPNGDTTQAAVDVVRRNYSAAVTTQKGWHRPGADLCLMRRVGLHEDISNRPASFLARVSCFV